MIIDDQRAMNTARFIANKMISEAGSGHPGVALGAAPTLYTLLTRHLVVDASNPDWTQRDRFVLSAGHASALWYSLLHLAGFAVSEDDLRCFRQLASRTPGHPEVGVTPGVDATTGPLGQGLGMAVGMALAQRHVNADHWTYAFVGDGDLSEGVSHEAADFAGQQQLKRLIVLYDHNHITLDGPLIRSSITNQAQRFTSYGWEVIQVHDGDDLAAIDRAITQAKQSNRPSLIQIQTTIGRFGPYEGTNQAHGTPLTHEQLADLKQALSLTDDTPDFYADVRQFITAKVQENYSKRPALASLTTSISKGNVSELSSGAGRDLGAEQLQHIAQQYPQLWGGAADLAGSTKTMIHDSDWHSAQQTQGRNIAFGIREFAMGTILNGIALHGTTRVFGSTFLAFSDYMRPAIRLSALQQLPVIYVFTHDSIAVGADGPTHQAVEQIMSLRQIPNVRVLRPGDSAEVAVSWQTAMKNTQGPTILILARQNLPQMSTIEEATETLEKGARVIQNDAQATVQLIASGSEVATALAVAQALRDAHQRVRLISMPDLQQFLQLDRATRQAIVIPDVPRVSLEAGTTLGWQAVVGDIGLTIGVDTFGDSGSAQALWEKFSLQPEQITQRILQFLNNKE